MTPQDHWYSPNNGRSRIAVKPQKRGHHAQDDKEHAQEEKEKKKAREMEWARVMIRNTARYGSLIVTSLYASITTASVFWYPS